MQNILPRYTHGCVSSSAVILIIGGDIFQKTKVPAHCHNFSQMMVFAVLFCILLFLFLCTTKVYIQLVNNFLIMFFVCHV